MTKDGHPITSVQLRNPLRTGISYSMDFMEMEACIAAGLDVERWEKLGPESYPRRLKARVVAWYLLHQTIKAHTDDAAIEKAKADARKSSKR